MNLWVSQQIFPRNNFRSKPHTFVASAHMLMTYTDAWSDLTYQTLGILKRRLSFSR